jgi:hypothetical protein
MMTFSSLSSPIPQAAAAAPAAAASPPVKITLRFSGST